MGVEIWLSREHALFLQTAGKCVGWLTRDGNYSPRSICSSSSKSICTCVHKDTPTDIMYKINSSSRSSLVTY